jgi:molybdopterin-guanine dinucleotide biosynthesis protein A
LQPLSALYRRRTLGLIRACLAAGENKVSRFFPRAQCLVVRWREIARAGFPPRILDNMNTRNDYEVARRILNSELPIANGVFREIFSP